MQEGIDDQKPYFRMLYICYATCKEGFKLCRYFTGLNGCFLKGLCGGEILAAIGRDPNDQMLPIAFVLVDNENKEAGHDFWSCFLMTLKVEMSVSHTHSFQINKRYVIFMMTLCCYNYVLCVLISNWCYIYDDMRVYYLQWMSFCLVLNRDFVLGTCIKTLGRSFMVRCWRNSYGKIQDQHTHKNEKDKWKEWDISYKFHVIIMCWPKTLCCRMSDEHIFEVRHLKNPADKFAVNLKGHLHKMGTQWPSLCSCPFRYEE